NGKGGTGEGGRIYLATVNGELYRLDVETGVFTHLGHFLPKQEYMAGARIDSLYGITLSIDEKRIYGIPRRSGSSRSNLYSYEIATGAVTLVREMEPALYTGSHMRDSRGNLSFSSFGDGGSSAGKARLSIVHS